MNLQLFFKKKTLYGGYNIRSSFSKRVSIPDVNTVITLYTCMHMSIDSCSLVRILKMFTTEEKKKKLYSLQPT